MCPIVRFYPLAIAGALATLAFGPTVQGQYTFTLLDVPEYGIDIAYGVGVGQQVGYGENSTDYDDRALLWTGSAGSVVNLDPGGVYLESRGLATDGAHQVGWARQGAGGGGNQHAALWTGSASTFVDLNPLGYYRSQAHGIDGDVQAGWAANLVDSHDHAMIWRGGHDEFTDLHPIHLPSYVDSYCLAAGGGTQAGYANASATHAAFWSGSSLTFLDLHPADAAYSLANATTGAMQGGFAVFGTTLHAALWSGTAATFIDLHPTGSSSSSIHGMDGGIQVGDSAGHAFLWRGTAESAVDLHTFVTGGFTGSSARAIAEDGTIAGLVSFGGPTFYAAMWVPVPEPSGLASLLTGVVFIGHCFAENGRERRDSRKQ